MSTSWLFKIATYRLLSIVKQSSVLPGTDIGWKNTFRDVVYEIIPNRRYTDGVITLVRSIYESCRQLNIDFRNIELSDWLMFQQSELEYPARNITFKYNYEFHITTVDYDKNTYRDIVRPIISKNYRLFLDKILKDKQKYAGRVVVKDYGVRKNNLWVHGEIQITILMDFYYKYATKVKINNGRLYGGVDVNVDRINLAVVDEKGYLRDIKTFWFRETTARGFLKRISRNIIGMKIHEMLKYAYNHGVKILFLENPEVLGRLKLLWIRNGDRKHENYNYKVSIFRSSIIEMITMKTPLYDIEIKYVNPRGTTSSKEHDKILKMYGLDKHVTSAYLIALKGLGHQ